MGRTSLTSLVVVTCVCAYLFSTAVGNYPNIGWRAPAWNNTNQGLYNNSAYPKQWNNTRYYPNQYQRYPQQMNNTNPWQQTVPPYAGKWNNNTRYTRNPAYSYGTSVSDHTSHNFIWGVKTPNDRLLYYLRVKKESSLMRKVTQDVEFPAKTQQPLGVICYIQILDQRPQGLGGYAEITRGGVGYKNVTLHLKSQRNKAFDFNIYIYGH